MYCLSIVFSLSLIFTSYECIAGFSGDLDISTSMVNSVGEWGLPTFSRLDSTPAGCLVRLSGTYEPEFPLYTNHWLKGSLHNDPDDDWFMKPAPDYLFSFLLFLGEGASLDHPGMDNRAFPLENDGQKSGIYLTSPETAHLSPVVLSTVSGLCYPIQAGGNQQTQGNHQSSHSPEPGGSTESVQSSSDHNRHSSPLSIYGSGSNDDDDDDYKDDQWRRSKGLMKSHYFDVDDFGGDWDEYSRYLTFCPTSRKVQLYADDKIARTYSYQKVGAVLTISGVATLGLLLRGRRARGGFLNLPWTGYAHVIENRINPVIYSTSWIYFLGLPFGLISQAWNFNLISIPKRQHLRELKRKNKDQ